MKSVTLLLALGLGAAVVTGSRVAAIRRHRIRRPVRFGAAADRARQEAEAAAQAERDRQPARKRTASRRSAARILRPQPRARAMRSAAPSWR